MAKTVLLGKFNMSKEILIGGLHLGGNNAVRIQSMTNTPTDDVKATVSQTIELADAGCDLVRITVRSIHDADLLLNIKQELISRNCFVPLIADVHFNPKVAEIAASEVEKVRINPGNYIDKRIGKTIFTDEDTTEAMKTARENIVPLIDICKRHKTAIRIGSNQGSLSDRIVFKYGDTAVGMVEAVMEFLNIFEELDFHNIVISLKSSNPMIMIEANRLLVKRMSDAGLDYPLHLGVTEAGGGQEARIKSAIGIGTLLCEGIGDTIRVSLSEPPIDEIQPAIDIAHFKNNIKCTSFDVSKRPTLSKSTHALSVIVSNYVAAEDASGYGLADFIVTEVGSHLQLSYFTNDNFFDTNIVDITGAPLKNVCRAFDEYFSATNYKPLIVKKYYNKDISISRLMIEAAIEYGFIINHYPISGIWTNVKESIMADILQATRNRLSKPEYISCPTCGRTGYDLMSVVDDVKKKTSDMKDITIGVMGCIVNGPGEMRGADYGVVGFGKDKVVLYKKGEQVGEPILSSDAADALVKLIYNDKKYYCK